MSEQLFVYDTQDTIKKQRADIQSIQIFDLVEETHPILKEVMPEWDFDDKTLDANAFASALVETCRKRKGYGLSANQCGFRKRVFVMGTGDNYVAFFNPKVIESRDEVHMAEGCLSYPMLVLNITRPAMIEVEYQDFNGIKHQAIYGGISARCFLHELDHMNGIVYTTRAKPLALQSGMKKRNKFKGLIAKATKANMMKELALNGNTNRVR